MDDRGLLAPRFVILHYFIEWFIDNFGLNLYLALIVVPMIMVAYYTLRHSAKNKEWDRFFMIIIFMLITLGGLIGLGFDIYHSQPIFR